jgi:hypothetical protein
MNAIPEKDWRQLRKLKDQKLNQACWEILNSVEHVINSKKNESHKCYLEVWKLVDAGDREIGVMFDDLRRSNAILKLASWRSKGLLSDEELNRFSEETRLSIERIASYQR